MKVDKKLMKRVREKYPTKEDRGEFHSSARYIRNQYRYSGDGRSDAQSEIVSTYNLSPNLLGRVCSKTRELAYNWADSDPAVALTLVGSFGTALFAGHPVSEFIGQSIGVNPAIPYVSSLVTSVVAPIVLRTVLEINEREDSDTNHFISLNRNLVERKQDYRSRDIGGIDL
jgi:hypothetical protein